MKKFYSIENSLNEKILGKIGQIKESKHHCHVWDDPNFIERFSFQEIKINPILSNLVLYSTSKLTDLILSGGIGFSGSMVISDKLKNIFKNFNCFGVQFFPTYLIQNKKEIYGYWQTHIYDHPFDYIDFGKTEIFLKNSENIKLNIQERLNISNINELHNTIKSLEYPNSISFNKIFFTDEMNYDFLNLRFFENGGSYGIVSERLKIEIEKEGCTGIEFRPIEITLNDWLKRDGPRDQLYGRSW
jgi:hypothetical protein